MEATPTRRRFGALPVLVAIGIAATAAAQTLTVVRHEPPPPVLLRLNVQEGLAVSYRMEMEMEGRVSAGLFGQPVELTVVMELDWRVQEVSEDGSASIEVETRLIEASSPQGDMPRSELQEIEGTSTMRLAADGSVLEGTLGATGSLTSSAPIPGLEGGFGPTFPPDPVAPGDRWDLSTEVPLLPGGPSLEVVGEASLDTYEEVGGIRSAVIDSEATVPFDFELDLAELAAELGEEIPGDQAQGTIAYEGEMTMSSRQWIDPETGLQVRMEGGGEGDIGFSLGGFPQNGDVPAVPRTTVEFELTMTLERL